MPSLNRKSAGCPLELLDQTRCLTVEGFSQMNTEVIAAVVYAAELSGGAPSDNPDIQAAADECVTRIKLGQCALYELTTKGFLFKKPS